jgi:hypothetical protein
VDLAPRVGVLVGLDAQQLLLVVPLEQGFALVEALVTLEADQARSGHLGDRFGELGLARTSWALDQHRLAEAIGEERHPRNAVVGQIIDAFQALPDLVDALKAVRDLCCHGVHATGHLDREVNRIRQRGDTAAAAIHVTCDDTRE